MWQGGGGGFSNSNGMMRVMSGATQRSLIAPGSQVYHSSGFGYTAPSQVTNYTEINNNKTQSKFTRGEVSPRTAAISNEFVRNGPGRVALRSNDEQAFTIRSFERFAPSRVPVRGNTVSSSKI